MEQNTALLWSWLNVLNKKRYDALMSVYEDLDAATKHLGAEMLKALGCREETIQKTLLRLEEFDPKAYEKILNKEGITLLTIEDEKYPMLLAEIGDPPIFLYAKGDLSILSQPCIACVGSREMTAYGKRATETFVSAFVKAGLVTVSGLAEGIDSVVAKETLHAGGKTVAVLGHGLTNIYPKSNARLGQEIVEAGGLILSEYPLDAIPDKYTFPARNRIIAGLSKATVVFQAGEGSGALITGELALDYGRETSAVPGEIFDESFRGCHQLISAGHAKLVSVPEDVLKEMGVVTFPETPRSSYQPASEEERTLLQSLTTMPQSVSVLQEKSTLPMGTINAALTMMELSGAVKNVGGGMWVRV